MCGRNTFTATGRPSIVTAKCTWAIDAAASASSLNSKNSSGIDPLSSVSTIFRAVPVGKGGNRSRSCPRSPAISAPRRSDRVESACPNLMKLGPKATAAFANRTPRASLAVLGSIFLSTHIGSFGKPNTSRESTHPYLASVRAILNKRRMLRTFRTI